MGQLRNFQFLRNSVISSFATYAAARTEAERAFAGITTLLDGEIALYSYKLDSDATKVHTLLGIKRTNGIEIVANYDELTAEYQSYVATEIAKLDTPEGGVTGSNNGVSVTVTQVDGKIDSVSVVAPSLTSAIEALDANPFSLTEVTGTELKGYQIYEEDGIIKKGTTAETLLTFATAPTATNKVVTLKEIQDLDTPEGGVSSADTNNVKVTVTQVDGIVNTVTVVDNSVNATDVNNAITTAIAGLKSNVENTNVAGDIKVKVSQANGELTSVEISDTLKAVAHTGAAADVSIADTAELFTATNVEAALAEVMTKANELDAAQLEEGIGIAIDGDNKINANFKLEIANVTNAETNATDTVIRIIDERITDGNNVIAETNANAFVKDGFLQKVEKDATTNELIFTWNTDAEGAGEANQVTKIPISDLCDVYTADETYLHLNSYKFEHKTITGVMGTYANNADNITVDSTDEKTFIIPTITVDGAGHVTAVNDKTVKISLPQSINTAVQTINGHTVNDSFITTAVTPSADNKTQSIEVTAQIGSVAGDTEGLAEATEVKDYVDSQIKALDESTTTVAQGTGISVSDAGTGNDHAYTVALAEAPATVTNNTDDYVAPEGTHTRISDITIDEYGRVTAVTKTTVKEVFDAGTY